MRILTIEILLTGLLLASASLAQADPLACQTIRQLAGPCFGVNGVLQLYNGTPSARITVSRTHRVLGVISSVDGGNEVLVAPKAVRDRASFDKMLQGWFEVCPLERAVANRMQSVCIARGAQLKTVP